MDRARNNCIRSSGSDHIRETAGASQVARRRGASARYVPTVGSSSIQRRRGWWAPSPPTPVRGPLRTWWDRTGALEDGERPLPTRHHVDPVRRTVDIEGGGQACRRFGQFSAVPGRESAFAGHPSPDADLPRRVLDLPAPSGRLAARVGTVVARDETGMRVGVRYSDTGGAGSRGDLL